MNKNDKKAKTEKTKDRISTMYDCCWYDPSCYHLCCGDVCCCCQVGQMVLRDEQPSRGGGVYMFGMNPNPYTGFLRKGKEERDDSKNQENSLCNRPQ